MATREITTDRSALSWLLIGASLITLFFWATLEDPFNAPKSWILYCSGVWLLGWVLFEVKRRWKNPQSRWVAILAGTFCATLFLAFCASDMKLQAFFGDFARRTGFLTYCCFVIFFLAASLQIRFSNVDYFDRVVLIVGFAVGGYGFAQHFKVDPIHWNNPYNSVLSTLGNPDFAAAVMAIFLVLAVGIAFNSAKATVTRISALIEAALLLITIVYSQVRQGLLAGAIGVVVILIVWLYQRNRAIAWSVSVLALLVGVVGFVGMLNKGPFKGYFYKVSVTFRGDYWRAGFRMFKSHPWFGVGLDRYGAYFRQYRDATQVLRRGPEIISNAAHNVPLQLAATGGIFVLMAFLAITGFIFWRGVIALRQTSGVHQILIATFFGAWLTYQAQSLISIDNVGIAIWGWLIGGIVVGLSHDSIDKKNEVKGQISSPRKVARKSSDSIAQPLVSGLLALTCLALCIPMYLSDSSMRTLRTYSPPKGADTQAYMAAAKKPLSFGFQDPHNKVSVALLIVQIGQIDEAKRDLQGVLASDPRSFDALDTLASIDEQTHLTTEGIKYRQHLAVIDPWNYKNLLSLGEDLKKVGDMAGAKRISQQIATFASSTPEAAAAKRDFGA